MGEFRGQVPEATPRRVWFGVAEVGLVVQTEQPGPGVEVGGEIAGEDPATVDGPGLRRQVPQTGGLVGADPVLDSGVASVQHVDPLWMV
jgi:hypothetical protein